jgi:predicted SAM-dependent methyltransferase
MVATLDAKINTLNQLDKSDLRLLLSSFYLQGQGIEVGALHEPLKLSSKAKVKYVDRLSVADLRRHYPELDSLNLVNVDIIDDGERLTTLPNNSQDFIVANHMLEHCMNPIQTLQTFLSKVKPGGIVYAAIPDKRFSFDKDRQLTTFNHLMDDYHNKNDHFQHYIEWSQLVDKKQGEQEIMNHAKHLLQMQYSIHFHVWDYYSFVDFLLKTSQFLNYSFDILNISFSDHYSEIISVLRRK